MLIIEKFSNCFRKENSAEELYNQTAGFDN